MTPSTKRQNAHATSEQQREDEERAYHCPPAAPPVVFWWAAAATPSSARRAAWPSGLSGASSTTFFHSAAAPCRSSLPKASTMPLLSSVLVCLGSSFRLRSNVAERLVGAVHVVVADAEIGVRVHVRGLELHGALVPRDRVVPALGVEVGVRQLQRRRGVLGIALEDRGQRLHLGFVQRRRLALGVAAGRPGRTAAAGAAAVVAAPPGRACCVPITQPRMMPKHIPATANTADSSFMNRQRSYRIMASEASPRRQSLRRAPPR